MLSNRRSERESQKGEERKTVKVEGQMRNDALSLEKRVEASGLLVVFFFDALDFDFRSALADRE